MAVYVSHDSRLLRRALAASIALHLLLALLLPAWSRLQSPQVHPVEMLSFAHLIRLQIVRPAARSRPRALPQAVKHSAPTSIEIRSELAKRVRSKTFEPRPVRGAPGPRAAAPQRSQAAPAPLYAAAPQAAAPAAAQQRPQPATPAPDVAPGARSITGTQADRGGVMPLGAEQDPVLDPRALAALRRIGAHVTLTVNVGEDGRTQSVAFDPPLDPSIERAIEAILSNADWDAAVCGGGVSCQGVATIRLR